MRFNKNCKSKRRRPPMQSGAFERGEQAHNLADRVRDFDGTRHSRRPPMDDPFCADMFYSLKNNSLQRYAPAVESFNPIDKPRMPDWLSCHQERGA